jgi:hypothetical protein
MLILVAHRMIVTDRRRTALNAEGRDQYALIKKASGALRLAEALRRQLEKIGRRVDSLSLGSRAQLSR